MDPSLYEPSLQEETVYTMRPYNIHRLFYVAFFAGIIPTMVLCRESALELKLPKKTIHWMLALGVVFLLGRAALVGAVSIGALTLARTTTKWIARGLNLLYYLVYYLFMRQAYTQCMMFGGEDKPMLKTALIWYVAGIVLELILYTAAGLLGAVFI